MVEATACWLSTHPVCWSNSRTTELCDGLALLPDTYRAWLDARGAEIGPRASNTQHEQTMNIEDAIAQLVREGGTRLKTASPGHKHYVTAQRLNFVPCRCSESEPTYCGHDFIAKTERGKCWYVGINTTTMGITCGTHGYHDLRNTPACI